MAHLIFAIEKVKGFDLNVPESTFDPLNSKYAGAGRSANGNAPEPHGPGGGFGAGGGNGGFGPAPGGGQDDAAAVLQLGMEFGVSDGKDFVGGGGGRFAGGGW